MSHSQPASQPASKRAALCFTGREMHGLVSRIVAVLSMLWEGKCRYRVLAPHCITYYTRLSWPCLPCITHSLSHTLSHSRLLYQYPSIKINTYQINAIVVGVSLYQPLCPSLTNRMAGWCSWLSRIAHKRDGRSFPPP